MKLGDGQPVMLYDNKLTAGPPITIYYGDNVPASAKFFEFTVITITGTCPTSERGQV